MWLVTVVDFCYGWSLWVFLTWLPSYLSDARGFKLDQIALMTTLPLLGGVVGDTLGGVISDAIFRRTGNLRLARRTLLVVGLGGAFAFIVPAIVTGSALGAVYLLAAAFFFLELTNAVLWTLPLDIAGQYAGTAGGMMNTGFGVAGMISPVVFGVLIQRTGHYELPFFISAGAAAGRRALLAGNRSDVEGRRSVGSRCRARSDSDRDAFERGGRLRDDMSSMRVRPTDAALGAEVAGRRSARARRRDRSRRSIARGSIIRCCSSGIKQLSDEDLVAFSRRFGDLDEAPVQETGQRFVEGHPEIYVVSNVVQDGVAIGSLGSGEAVWHTDMSYLPDPPKASALYALEVPPSGGDTSFCSMYAAWDAAARTAATPRRRASGETRRHLQQRRLRATGRDADRRSAHLARHVSPARLRPSGNRTARPLSRSPAQRLHRRAVARRFRARCSTRSGPRPRATRSPGGTSGGSAISCSGTTAARCIAATRSIRRPVASCTARRSKPIAGLPRPGPERHACARVPPLQAANRGGRSSRLLDDD